MLFILEFRRPEGSPSGPPYSYRKEKETNEGIFSWLSWLALLLVGAYARRRRRRRRRRFCGQPLSKQLYINVNEMNPLQLSSGFITILA